MSEGKEREGYRLEPRGGPRVRTDVLDVYLFRRSASAGDRRFGGEVEFLQLCRASAPLAKSWQPVMGHIEPGESATVAALRELCEEVGLSRDARELLGFWALEQTSPYYVAAIDSVVLSPRFAGEVAAGWVPKLNEENSAARWIGLPSDPDAADAGVLRRALDHFHWPGQKAAALEIVREIVRTDSPARAAMEIRLRP